MNNSVMGSSNIRYICKTGYMGYCDSSAYQSLPLNSRYIIVNGSGGSIDAQIADLYNKFAGLEDDLAAEVLARSTADTGLSGRVSTLETTVGGLDTRVTALENSTSGGGAGSIISLYEGSAFVSSITVPQALNTFDVIFIKAEDSSGNTQIRMITQDGLDYTDPIVVIVGTNALTYNTTATYTTLTTSGTSSDGLYVKQIVGVRFA